MPFDHYVPYCFQARFAKGPFKRRNAKAYACLVDQSPYEPRSTRLETLNGVNGGDTLRSQIGAESNDGLRTLRTEIEKQLPTILDALTNGNLLPPQRENVAIHFGLMTLCNPALRDMVKMNFMERARTTSNIFEFLNYATASLDPETLKFVAYQDVRKFAAFVAKWNWTVLRNPSPATDPFILGDVPFCLDLTSAAFGQPRQMQQFTMPLSPSYCVKIMCPSAGEPTVPLAHATATSFEVMSINISQIGWAERYVISNLRTRLSSYISMAPAFRAKLKLATSRANSAV